MAEVAEPVEPPATVDQLAQLILQEVGVYSHAMGIFATGPASDPQAVVDGEGNVHGLINTFVADATIIPALLRANTNLTCMLIGYGIADAIRAHLCAWRGRAPHRVLD
jgi:choline dehydrogenase